MAKLNKICKIERSLKNKIYHKGTVLIQISASKGETILLEEDSVVKPSMYACIIPEVDIDSSYLKISIDEQMSEFLSKYKSGLNIPIDNLKYLNISNKHIKEQRVIAEFVRLHTLYKKQTELLIDLELDLKKYFLSNMFV